MPVFFSADVLWFSLQSQVLWMLSVKLILHIYAFSDSDIEDRTEK